MIASVSLADLRRTPNALARHYTRFRVAERPLLTGHSHQAWPDVAVEGQLEAFTDAATEVDGKWARAFAKAEEVRAGYRRLLDDDAPLALGASTHDLLVRLLSALDLRRRPRLVTTDGEFHSLRRQLARLAEEGVEVVRVPAEPVGTLAERLAAAVDGRTSAVLVSRVLFATARIVPDLGTLARTCADRDVELVVDAYHALGVLPTPVPRLGLDTAWVLAGGYKYLQLGEGNCVLRMPPHAERLRPVVTGWFAEFGSLSGAPGERVGYAPGGDRFAGATYDPTSHYRAARVFGFFTEHGLTPEFLRAVSQHQVGLLAAAFDALDLPEQEVRRDRSVPLTEVAGFLALRCRDAERLRAGLAERGVSVDCRGEYLRFGPAPYLSDAQLEAAMAALGEVVRDRSERARS
ncbi:Selenocysteine lyase/Cysteine desulfurase [Amycolatopsis arida]|uniref:Selenocysteine lyase/Cysteine desulfurase n=1 Tax=Amycolatopsis arida TaxID=587909 RepID=A0A1I5P516_9PSEU|nr:kynureninase [Amycolatopsis arida]TDX98353.1 selenocysteine lyase/cysteine desulfurase [Amycolatopsis arida]SFP28920.1 Selenocysteine lyase/Cysteine desulfurase [Amycolatopsis arida]